MADISGFLPSILYNEIPHENYENLYSKGSDIDITINNGSSTHISGITLGNGTWEIDQLDDNLNLFPEYSEGDVISRDVLLKVLTSVSAMNQSRNIFSFNLLGKVKYGIQDKTEGLRDKVTKAKQWLTDEITPEIAQDFLQKSYPGARVGKLDKYSSKDGGIYKVMFGVPSEKKYYVMCLQRNGNKIHELDDDDYKETPIYSFTDGNMAMKAYEQYPSEEGLESTEDEASEITLEEIQGAMGNDSNFASYNVIDFENVENEDFLINGRPTAIAFIAGTVDDKIMVGSQQFWRTEEGTVEIGNGQTQEVKSKNDVPIIVKWAINLYKQYGGTKDLSYLLKENNFEEEAPTSGSEDGYEWEIKQSARKKKKKSEFWGKNVTGYEDGMLGDMICEGLLSSNLKSTFDEEMNELLKLYRDVLEAHGFEITDYGIVEGSSLIWDQYIKFQKDGTKGRIYMSGGAGNYEGFFNGIVLKGTGSLEFDKELKSFD